MVPGSRSQPYGNLEAAKEKGYPNGRSAVPEPGNHDDQVVKLRIHDGDVVCIVDDAFKKDAYEEKKNKNQKFQSFRDVIHGVR